MAYAIFSTKMISKTDCFIIRWEEFSLVPHLELMLHRMKPEPLLQSEIVCPSRQGDTILPASLSAWCRLRPFSQGWPSSPSPSVGVVRGFGGASINFSILETNWLSCKLSEVAVSCTLSLTHFQAASCLALPSEQKYATYFCIFGAVC